MSGREAQGPERTYVRTVVNVIYESDVQRVYRVGAEMAADTAAVRREEWLIVYYNNSSKLSVYV